MWYSIGLVGLISATVRTTVAIRSVPQLTMKVLERNFPSVDYSVI